MRDIIGSNGEHHIMLVKEFFNNGDMDITTCHPIDVQEDKIDHCNLCLMKSAGLYKIQLH